MKIEKQTVKDTSLDGLYRQIDQLREQGWFPSGSLWEYEGPFFYWRYSQELARMRSGNMVVSYVTV